MQFIIFFIIVIVISSLSSSAKKKFEEEQKRYGNQPQRIPQTYTAGDTRQQTGNSIFGEGESTANRTELKPTQRKLESTIKPTKATVHTSKEVPDPDCEPHKPVKSTEGDPRYRMRQPRKPKEPDAVPVPSILSEMNYDNNSLIKGIIYSEIYGKPKSRR